MHYSEIREEQAVNREMLDVEHYFGTLAIPYLPCMGMTINWYIIVQLDLMGILLLCFYLGLTAAIYLPRFAPNSVLLKINDGNYLNDTAHTSSIVRLRARCNAHCFLLGIAQTTSLSRSLYG